MTWRLRVKVPVSFKKKKEKRFSRTAFESFPLRSLPINHPLVVENTALGHFSSREEKGRERDSAGCAWRVKIRVKGPRNATWAFSTALIFTESNISQCTSILNKKSTLRSSSNKILIYCLYRTVSS